MNEVLVTGANGWIGGKLANRLVADGWTVTGVSRTPAVAAAARPDVRWIGTGAELEQEAARIGRVVNLAGRHPFEQRWDDAFKAAMYDSRIGTTARIAAALAEVARPDTVLVSGSGFPVYGDTGDAAVTEEQPVSRATFGALMDADWEDATAVAGAAGVRVVLARIGLGLGFDGGALPMLAAPGPDGRLAVLGGGRQWVPWIHVDDLVAALFEALVDPRWNGPCNLTSPEPVRHADLIAALAELTGQPVGGSLPEEALAGIVGEASEILLVSSRLVPQRATALGFRVARPVLADALASLRATTAAR